MARLRPVRRPPGRPRRRRPSSKRWVTSVEARSGVRASSRAAVSNSRCAVMVAVGEGGNDGRLLHEQSEADRDRCPEAAEHADRPARVGRRAMAGVHGLLGAGRVEDDVVVGADVQWIPPSRSAASMRLARWATTSGTMPSARQDGDGAEPDGPGADDEHPHPVAHAGPVDAVEGHGQAVRPGRRPRGSSASGKGRAHDGSTQAASAMPPSRLMPHMASRRGRALLHCSRPATVAAATVLDRENGDRRCRRRAGRRTRGRGSPVKARTRRGARRFRRCRS